MCVLAESLRQNATLTQLGLMYVWLDGVSGRFFWGKLYDGILLMTYDPRACISFAHNEQLTASVLMEHASWLSR